MTGYRPEHVAASSGLLAERVARLTFISTVSVYDDVSRPGTAEDAPLAALTGAAGQSDYGMPRMRRCAPRTGRVLTPSSKHG